jgi:twitching motility protein PilT
MGGAGRGVRPARRRRAPAGRPAARRPHELPDSPLTSAETEPLLLSACPPDAADRLLASKNADFSFRMRGRREGGGFRATLFLAGGAVGGCFRLIPDAIPDLAWAGFPPDLASRIVGLRDGLVIVTGATGSGKSTTLAMLVTGSTPPAGYRIITVEEPVEYRFPPRNSVVTQREVGTDVLSFADGLKYGLRRTRT